MRTATVGRVRGEEHYGSSVVGFCVSDGASRPDNRAGALQFFAVFGIFWHVSSAVWSV